MYTHLAWEVNIGPVVPSKQDSRRYASLAFGYPFSKQHLWNYVRIVVYSSISRIELDSPELHLPVNSQGSRS